MKKTTPIPAADAIDKIEHFLISQNWSISGQTDTAIVYKPPKDLGFDERFSILLPVNRDTSHASNLLMSIIQTLSDIYDIKFTDIIDFESNESWLIKSRLVDRSIGKGDIPLVKLDNYLKGITKSLYEVAKYQTEETDNKKVVFASKFIDSCKFLRTDVGSFITSIEIPSIPVSPKGLFGDEGINSHQIASSWFNAMAFINNRILQGQETIGDSLVHDALEKLNLPSAEAMAEMIQGANISNFEFQLVTDLGAMETSSGRVDDISKERLHSFIKLYREKLTTEDEASFFGSITDLHSSNPAGNANRIFIKSNVYGDITRVSLTLNNADYEKAIKAHLSGRPVSVVGNVIRLKAYIKVTKIKSFEVS